MDLSPALRAHLAYPKFQKASLTILQLRKTYHLMNECAQALTAAGHKVVPLTISEEPQEMLRSILVALVQQKPDFVLSINHFGFDSDGQIGAFLDSLQIPIAVWYVDNPLFVLRGGRFPAPQYTKLFSWERSFTADFQGKLSREPEYLPLAAGLNNFRSLSDDYRNEVVFVGASLAENCEKWKDRIRSPKQKAAEKKYLKEISFGAMARLFSDKFDSSRDELDSLAAAVWQKTQERRVGVLRESGVELQLYGDQAWPTLLQAPRFRGAINYGDELFSLYRDTLAQINVTSYQMPTAVNQRVFDVPAAGGCLISDQQEDLEQLFSGVEYLSYRTPSEISEIVQRLREKPEWRQELIEGQQKCIAEKHTYRHRLEQLLSSMRREFR